MPGLSDETASENSPVGLPSYSSFWECIENVGAVLFFLAEMPDEKDIQVLTWIEKTYSCTGLCRQQLFYVANSLDDGPPENTCFPKVHHDLQDEMTFMGLSMILAAFCILNMFVVQFFLWRKASDD